MRRRLLALLSTLCLVVGLAAMSPASAAADPIPVSGTVLGDDGEPLPGVAVHVRPAEVHDMDAYLTTDADGRFTLTLEPRSEGYLVDFSKGDEWRSVASSAAPRVDGPAVVVNAQLVRFGSVSGSITYADGDGPGTARARLRPVEAPNLITAETPIAGDGTFRFDRVSPGRYYVDYPSTAHGLRYYGHTDQQLYQYVDVAPAQDVELPPEQSGPYPTGRLTVDLTGTDRLYPRVIVYGADGRFVREDTAFRSTFSSRQATTFEVMPPGKYKISLTDGVTWYGGKSFASASVVEVIAGETTTVQARPGPAVYVRGRFVNEIGEPVTARSLELLRDDSPGEVVTDLVTDGLGPFEVDDLEPARYSVRISDPWGVYETRTVGLTNQSEPTSPDDPPPTYRLEQRAPSGPAYAGPASASAYGQFSSGRGAHGVCFYPTNGRSGAEIACGQADYNNPGHYEVEGIKPGDYKARTGFYSVDVDGTQRNGRGAVWLGGRSFASASTVTFAAGERKELDVPGHPDEGLLTGVVKGRFAVPLPAVTVFAYAADDSSEVIRSAFRSPGGGTELVHVRATWRLADLTRRPYKLKLVDPTGRYEDTWLGGSSFETATVVTPRIDDTTYLPDATMTPRLGALAPPVLSGTAKVGATLATTGGFWTRPDLTYAYRWLADGTPIAGATGSKYRPTSAVVGRRLSVRVTARNGSGSDAATTSLPTNRVPAPTKVAPAVRVKAKALGKGRVRLTMSYSTPGQVPTGRVTVRRGSKTVLSWRTLREGRLAVTLRRQPRGRVRYTVRYSGSDTVHSDTRRTSRVRVR